MSAAQPLPTNSSRSAGKRRREFNEPPRGMYAGQARFYLALPKNLQHGMTRIKARHVEGTRSMQSQLISANSASSAFPLTRKLSRKRRQRRRVPGRHGGARCIEDHRQHRVVAGDAEDVDDALF